MFESKTPFESNTFKRAYLFGSVIVWVSILIGTAVVLSGTPYFAQILPILSVGLIWFIVLLPSAYFWTRPKSDQAVSNEVNGAYSSYWMRCMACTSSMGREGKRNILCRVCDLKDAWL